MRFYLVFLFTLPLIFISCSTTEPVIEKEPEPSIFELDEEIAEEYLLEEMEEMDMFLFEHRMYLSNRFAILEHDIPETYLIERVREESEADRYAGFRVQLLATRNIAEADSASDEFRIWASERIDGYEPNTYVFFRQPYYRVRAGDFRDRDTAIEFSRLIKNRFPGAWVVHDRIEPDQVPSDNTEFQLRDMRRIEFQTEENSE